MATGAPPGRRRKPQPETSNGEFNTPTPPAGLTADGQRVWNVLFTAAKDFIDPKVDILQAETFCYLYQETEDMRRQLALGKAGGGIDRVVSMNKGQTLARHPYVQDIKDNRAMMTSILSSFGFTPADRAKLNFEREVTNEALDAIRDIRRSHGSFGGKQ